MKQAAIFTVCFFLLAVYVVVAFHAGCLCSDELCAVSLAKMPIAQLPHWILFDSYPVLWPLVLKCWIDEFGQSDCGLRIFGLLIQLAIIAAIFIYCRAAGTQPRISFALLLFLPVFINHASAMRAWGLGILTLTLTYASVRRLMAESTPDRFMIATACAVLAVQSTYYNSVLLFALLVPAILIHRQRPELLAVGIIAALTMVPYAPIFAAAPTHYRNLHVAFTALSFWSHLAEAGTGGNFVLLAAWLLCAAGFIWLARKFIYETLVVVVAVPAYFLFLHQLHYQTQTWYYLPLITLLVLTLESMFKQISNNRLAIAITLLFLAQLPGAFVAAKVEQNNTVAITEFVSEKSGIYDLTVFPVSQLERSWDYYYHGQGRVINAMGLTNLFVTRYDEENDYIAAHTEPDASNIIWEIRQTLANCHKVFIISPADWKPRRTFIPSIAQLETVATNMPMNYYHEAILQEQIIKAVQAMTNRMELFEPPHSNPMEHYSVLTIYPTQQYQCSLNPK